MAWPLAERSKIVFRELLCSGGIHIIVIFPYQTTDGGEPNSVSLSKFWGNYRYRLTRNHPHISPTFFPKVSNNQLVRNMFQYLYLAPPTEIRTRINLLDRQVPFPEGPDGINWERNRESNPKTQGYEPWLSPWLSASNKLKRTVSSWEFRLHYIVITGSGTFAQ